MPAYQLFPYDSLLCSRRVTQITSIMTVIIKLWLYHPFHMRVPRLEFIKANSKYRASLYDAECNVVKDYKVATFNDGDIEADYQYLGRAGGAAPARFPVLAPYGAKNAL